MEIEDSPIPPFRLEEEEEVEDEEEKLGMGFVSVRGGPKANQRHPGSAMNEAAAVLVSRLMDERQAILEQKGISPRQKISLLETNRKALVIARGGSVRKTENVVYSILIFSSVVIVILACLTAFSGLPQEVTLAFVGTVVGGTISIIAQKLGKM